MAEGGGMSLVADSGIENLTDSPTARPGPTKASRLYPSPTRRQQHSSSQSPQASPRNYPGLSAEQVKESPSKALYLSSQGIYQSDYSDLSNVFTTFPPYSPVSINNVDDLLARPAQERHLSLVENPPPLLSSQGTLINKGITQRAKIGQRVVNPYKAFGEQLLGDAPSPHLHSSHSLSSFSSPGKSTNHSTNKSTSPSKNSRLINVGERLVGCASGSHISVIEGGGLRMNLGKMIPSAPISPSVSILTRNADGCLRPGHVSDRRGNLCWDAYSEQRKSSYPHFRRDPPPDDARKKTRKVDKQNWHPVPDYQGSNYQGTSACDASFIGGSANAPSKTQGTENSFHPNDTQITTLIPGVFDPARDLQETGVTLKPEHTSAFEFERQTKMPNEISKTGRILLQIDGIGAKQLDPQERKKAEELQKLAKEMREPWKAGGKNKIQQGNAPVEAPSEKESTTVGKRDGDDSLAQTFHDDFLLHTESKLVPSLQTVEAPTKKGHQYKLDVDREKDIDYAIVSPLDLDETLSVNYGRYIPTYGLKANNFGAHASGGAGNIGRNGSFTVYRTIDDHSYEKIVGRFRESMRLGIDDTFDSAQDLDALRHEIESAQQKRPAQDANYVGGISKGQDEEIEAMKQKKKSWSPQKVDFNRLPVLEQQPQAGRSPRSEQLHQGKPDAKGFSTRPKETKAKNTTTSQNTTTTEWMPVDAPTLAETVSVLNDKIPLKTTPQKTPHKLTDGMPAEKASAGHTPIISAAQIKTREISKKPKEYQKPRKRTSLETAADLIELNKKIHESGFSICDEFFGYRCSFPNWWLTSALPSHGTDFLSIWLQALSSIFVAYEKSPMFIAYWGPSIGRLCALLCGEVVNQRYRVTREARLFAMGYKGKIQSPTSFKNVFLTIKTLAQAIYMKAKQNRAAELATVALILKLCVVRYVVVHIEDAFVVSPIFSQALLTKDGVDMVSPVLEKLNRQAQVSSLIRKLGKELAENVLSEADCLKLIPKSVLLGYVTPWRIGHFQEPSEDKKTQEEYEDELLSVIEIDSFLKEEKEGRLNESMPKRKSKPFNSFGDAKLVCYKRLRYRSGVQFTHHFMSLFSDLCAHMKTLPGAYDDFLELMVPSEFLEHAEHNVVINVIEEVKRKSVTPIPSDVQPIPSGRKPVSVAPGSPTASRPSKQSASREQSGAATLGQSSPKVGGSRSPSELGQSSPKVGQGSPMTPQPRSTLGQNAPAPPSMLVDTRVGSDGKAFYVEAASGEPIVDPATVEKVKSAIAEKHNGRWFFQGQVEVEVEQSKEDVGVDVGHFLGDSSDESEMQSSDEEPQFVQLELFTSGGPARKKIMQQMRDVAKKATEEDEKTGKREPKMSRSTKQYGASMETTIYEEDDLFGMSSDDLLGEYHTSPSRVSGISATHSGLGVSASSRKTGGHQPVLGHSVGYSLKQSHIGELTGSLPKPPGPHSVDEELATFKPKRNLENFDVEEVVDEGEDVLMSLAMNAGPKKIKKGNGGRKSTRTSMRTSGMMGELGGAVTPSSLNEIRLSPFARHVWSQMTASVDDVFASGNEKAITGAQRYERRMLKRVLRQTVKQMHGYTTETKEEYTQKVPRVAEKLHNKRLGMLRRSGKREILHLKTKTEEIGSFLEDQESSGERLGKSSRGMTVQFSNAALDEAEVGAVERKSRTSLRTMGSRASSSMQSGDLSSSVSEMEGRIRRYSESRASRSSTLFDPKAIYLKVWHKKIAQVFALLDKDGSGELDYDEVKMIYGTAQNISEQHCMECMTRFLDLVDVNHDGVITSDEWFEFFAEAEASGKYTAEKLAMELNLFIKGTGTSILDSAFGF